MQFDAEDFFFLDKIREDLKSRFVGVAGVIDVYWLPYMSAFAKGKHKWYIQVYLVTESFDSRDNRFIVYDQEANFYSEYPTVLWNFQFVYLRGYSSPENFTWNMDHAGFVSVDPLKSLGKGEQDTAGKPH